MQLILKIFDFQAEAHNRHAKQHHVILVPERLEISQLVFNHALYLERTERKNEN